MRYWPVVLLLLIVFGALGVSSQLGTPLFLRNSVDNAVMKRITSITNKQVYGYVAEVSVGQFRAFCNATNYSFEWDGAENEWFANDNWPMTHVSVEDAKAYASWVKGRLPTREEWFAMASPNGSRYSWGDNFPPDSNTANLAGKELVTEYPSTFSGRVIDRYSDPAVCLANVGTLGASSSSGLYDLAGNVKEICVNGQISVTCGSSWRSWTEAECNVSTVSTVSKADDIGFRCVMETSP